MKSSELERKGRERKERERKGKDGKGRAKVESALPHESEFQAEEH